MSGQTAWSAAEKADLATLWASGLSCGKIGERIDRSKNSVISQVHRMELPPRPSPVRNGKAPLTIEERREHVLASQHRMNLIRKAGLLAPSKSVPPPQPEPRANARTLPPLPSQVAEPVVVYTVPRPVAVARPAPRRMAPTTHRFELPPARPRPEPGARAAYAGISTCQFPRQDATEHGGTTWLFCDAPATRGAYCDPHGDACYLGRRRAVAEALAA